MTTTPLQSQSVGPTGASNVYTVEFFNKCPVNGVRIKYTLTISRSKPLGVETLLDTLEGLDEGFFHEEIADRLAQRFEGMHVLQAEHHGVNITTARVGTEDEA